VTVWRWLSEDAIKPWQHRSRIFPPDLEFTEKAGRILDLYSRRWEGELLHPGDYVVSCDEKPSIQPRRRKATPRSLPRLVSCAGSTSSTNTNPKARSAASPVGTRGAPSYSIARHQGRDRPVRCARRAVHEDRALQQGPARVRDRRQRLSAPRPALDQPTPRPIQEPDPRPRIRRCRSPA
jgi:hypothetical protein